MDGGDDTRMVDDALAIAALCRLPALEYDRVRRAEAARLGVRPDTLDRQVAAARHLEAAPGDADGFALHEDGLALAFTAKFRDRLRYCHTTKAWFAWDGAVWRQEQTRLAFAWARELGREMAAEPGVEDEVRAVVAKAATAGAIERFAMADRAFAVTHEVWDRDPWRLGTPEGTVDLRTGALEPGRPGDLITRCTSVAPAPEGTPAPMWAAFLEEATRGDADLQGFLQRLAGYLLTGDVTEEMMAFIYGRGGNGKGVFLGAITSILGSYGVAVPIEVFTAGSRLNLEYYRAQMAGARLVTASETEAGATWAESQIKEMTGNETPLSARQPFGRAFTYRPQFKIVLVGNHAPKLKGRTPAMERRLRVLPFTNAPREPDKGLKERLAAEHPAVLRWMLDGCLSWGRQGLGTARVVAEATGQYFEQQDGFSRWLEECCVLDPVLAVKPGLLHASHTAWARGNGEDVTSANEFAELLDRTPGLERRKSNGARVVRGVGLRQPSEGGDWGG